MNPGSHSFCLAGAASKARSLSSVGRHQNYLGFLAVMLIFNAVYTTSLFVDAASFGPTGKKLIEYGWDVPTPAQMRDELVAMEKRPFDGLIFRLGGGHNAFVTKPLEPAKFADDERILRGLEFTRFWDNFVLIWGSPAADFDW